MTDNADLKKSYVAQVEADLQRNAQDRERIASEVAALTEQLATLESNHALLVGMRQALAGESGTVQDAPAQPAPTPKAAAGRMATGTAGVRAPRAGKSAAAKTFVKSTSADGRTSTLRELAVAHLATSAEPASAAEVATALAQAHPERPIQVTVVRNTLEALVAKGQATRTKQKRAVFYSTTTANTVVDETEPATS